MITDENISWEQLPGWEPSPDYDPLEDLGREYEQAGSCAYCGDPEVRPNPEPFGGQPCCQGCFLTVIGEE